MEQKYENDSIERYYEKRKKSAIKRSSRDELGRSWIFFLGFIAFMLFLIMLFGLNIGGFIIFVIVLGCILS